MSCKYQGGCKCGIRPLYESLPAGDHFRILEVLPGFEGDLECILHVAQLPEDASTYEALSYTWETDYWVSEETSTVSIRCNGTEINIGVNLASALRRIRKKEASRIIWVDALCINQNALAERSQQVSKMGAIYKNALQVIVWLGGNNGENVLIPTNHDNRSFPTRPKASMIVNNFEGGSSSSSIPPSSPESRQGLLSVGLPSPYSAFSSICAIVNHWRQVSGNDAIIPSATHSLGLDIPQVTAWNMSHSLITTNCNQNHTIHDGPPSTVEAWDQILGVYNRRWFSRVWVIQEITLARSAIVLWGDCEIPWEWIGLAAAIIRTNFNTISGLFKTRSSAKLFDVSEHMGIINAYFMFRLSSSQKYIPRLQFSFQEILKLTRQFECGDDRDRIYGLLGLPTVDNVNSTIFPDYSKSVAEVYCLVANRLLDSSSSLSILSSVQRTRDEADSKVHVHTPPSRKPFDRTMPSWVPQWNVVMTRSLAPQKIIGPFGPLSQQVQRIVTNNPLELQVRGMIIDHVDSGVYSQHHEFVVPENQPHWPRDENDSSEFGALIELLQNSLRSRRHLEKIALTLTAGQDCYGLPVEDVSTHLAGYLRCLLDGCLWWTLQKDAFSTMSKRTVHLVYFGYTPSPEMKATLESLIHHWQLEETIKDSSSISFLNAGATISSQRARFTTRRGMIGIGPVAMKREDLLCVLYGADAPFIIRKRSDGPGYILVGECYVYDLTSDNGGWHHDEAASEEGQARIQGEDWIELY